MEEVKPMETIAEEERKTEVANHGLVLRGAGSAGSQFCLHLIRYKQAGVG